MAQSDVPLWKHVLLWLDQWVLFWGAWMLFVCKFDPAEMIVGLFAAALAATASHAVWATNLAQIVAHPRWFAQAWRLPWDALLDTGIILGVLARYLFTRRPVESQLLALPFDAGGDDADSATRRALAIAYTTITPNSIVVGIDRQANLLLYHQLRRGRVLRLTRNLGARG